MPSCQTLSEAISRSNATRVVNLGLMAGSLAAEKLLCCLRKVKFGLVKIGMVIEDVHEVIFKDGFENIAEGGNEANWEMIIGDSKEFIGFGYWIDYSFFPKRWKVIVFLNSLSFSCFLMI